MGSRQENRRSRHILMWSRVGANSSAGVSGANFAGVATLQSMTGCIQGESLTRHEDVEVGKTEKRLPVIKMCVIDCLL